ncbi:MAG: ABC transporter ATP-binding protein, partial [Caldilineaceae bacterium]
LLRGVSGSGKTTLLNILSGMLPPTAGQVWLDDEPLYMLSESGRDLLRARTIGYVFQSHLLVPTLSALENVEMPLVFARELGAAERRSRALAGLDRLGLADFARHRPVQLSTGQRLRVAVARALVNRPRLLLADEPTAALDPDSGVRVVDLLQSASREQGSTLIVSSHDPALNRRFDRTIDLHTGKLTDVLEPHPAAHQHFARSLLAVEGPRA